MPRNRKAYFDEYNARPERKAAAAARPKDPAYMREMQLRRHGWTTATFEAAKEQQGGACAICREAKKLVADHDHSTGKARAALCHKCNIELGLYEKIWRARGARWAPLDDYLARFGQLLD